MQRDGPTIHPPDAPPAGADVPRKDEVERAGIRRPLIVVGINQPSFCQERVQGRRWLGEGEHRLDVRVLGPGADIIRPPATAEHAADRVNNDGLTGSGLAGQDVEAGAEPDMHVGQQRKVLDGQLVQHGALTGPPSPAPHPGPLSGAVRVTGANRPPAPKEAAGRVASPAPAPGRNSDGRATGPASTDKAQLSPR